MPLDDQRAGTAELNEDDGEATWATCLTKEVFDVVWLTPDPNLAAT